MYYILFSNNILFNNNIMKIQISQIFQLRLWALFSTPIKNYKNNVLLFYEIKSIVLFRYKVKLMMKKNRYMCNVKNPCLHIRVGVSSIWHPV